MLSLKLRKIAPDQQRNLIVANMASIGEPKNGRAFKKKSVLTPVIRREPRDK